MSSLRLADQQLDGAINSGYAPTATTARASNLYTYGLANPTSLMI